MNGRNQESSSEAVNAYYAVALYGHIMAQVWIRPGRFAGGGVGGGGGGVGVVGVGGSGGIGGCYWCCWWVVVLVMGGVGNVRVGRGWCWCWWGWWW